MKSCQSKSLEKEVFDEYRHFLSKKHKYHTTGNDIFNGKHKIGLKPQRMTPHLCKLAYDKINPRCTHFFMYHKWNHVLKFYFNYSIYFIAFDK
jgi:hypothetical protein